MVEKFRFDPKKFLGMAMPACTYIHKSINTIKLFEELEPHYEKNLSINTYMYTCFFFLLWISTRNILKS